MSDCPPPALTLRVACPGSHRRPRIALGFALAAAALSATHLSGQTPAPRPAVSGERPQEASGPDRDILVLAAASLSDALPPIALGWTASGERRVRFSFDATSRLAPQTAAGAPADVFLSADGEWMRWLEERGLVRAGTARVFAENELVVVVPRGAPSPRSPGDLARLETLGVAGENVPAGRYARAALATADVPPDAPRLVTGGSVRGVLEWVVRGQVDGGVVYRTDALVEPGVEVAFAFGGEGIPAVRYWAAPLVRSHDPAAAARFVESLSGSRATAIFAAAGFRSPAVSPSTEAAQSLSEAQSLPEDVVPSLRSAWSAVRLSIIVALLATALGLLPAVGLGWLLARHDFRGKTLVSTLVLSPLVMPPVVTGFLLLTLLGAQSPLGRALASLGLPVPFTLLGAALAAFVVGLPLYVLSVRAAFEAVDAQYEALSRTMGVPPWPTFLRVSLPLAAPGIAAGAVLAFARALGEFGATIVLAGNVEGSTRTIPLAVYSLLESPSGRDATWILVVASIALSLLALLGFEALSRRQRRRLEHDHAR